MSANLPIDELIKIAVNNKEGVIASNGALVVTTGKRTGRSPADKFIVDDAITRFDNRVIDASVGDVVEIHEAGATFLVLKGWARLVK